MNLTRFGKKIAIGLFAIVFALVVGRLASGKGESNDSNDLISTLQDHYQGYVAPSGTPFDFMENIKENEGEALSLPPGVDIPLGGTNEPTIAVDPTNPSNLAYASLVQLRVSTDGGNSFQPFVTYPVSPGQVQCGDPSLAFDSQGRLFWTFLGCSLDAFNNLAGIDIYIAQSNPTTGAILAGYPVNITAGPGVNLPAANGFAHDKEWLAADCFSGSPFVDQLYVVWTEFQAGSTLVLTTFSSDQGLTWSAALQLSGAGEGFVWPSHNTVAPNGDVYVAYHSQTGYSSNAPDGISGQVFALRSTNGGVSYPQKNNAYGPGAADITFNVAGTVTIPGTRFWLQGSAQPWIMADPIITGRVYTVANDDPDNNHTSGDDADVFITISTDNGLNWGTPSRIDSGPDTTFQVMPTAAIDKESGCIVAHYYDNRNGNTNSAGRFLLDVFSTASTDGGVTFTPDFQINDVAFDPDSPPVPFRFFGTTRIGEYNGVAASSPNAFYVWCSNGDSTINPLGIAQQTLFDKDTLICFVCTDIVDPPEVRTQGFWRRVCKKPHPEEPDGVDPYAADAIAFGSPLFDGFDADSICALMAVSPPENDMCRKARRQFMAVLLNLASGRLGLCNCIDSDLTSATTVEEVVAEIIGLLSGSPDHATCVLAKSLAAEINEGSSLIPCNGSGKDPDQGEDGNSWDKTIEEGLIETSIAQNIPNPFPNATDILYRIKGAVDSRNPSILSEGLSEKVLLRIYDLAGREVRTLVDAEQESGIYRITWDGKNQRGEDLSSGIYFYQIKIGDLTATRKMVLLR
jgi:hypothetical protein